MSVPIPTIARRKRNDLYIQIIVAVIALVAMPFTFLCSLYLLGATHAIGTCYWMDIRKKHPELPVVKGRKILQPINLVVTVLLVVALPVAACLPSDGLLGVSMCMIYIGLILGPWYFILAIREIAFYKRLASHVADPDYIRSVA